VTTQNEPAPIGSTPRRDVLLFPFGTTYTKQYGPLEFDHADAAAVMHYYQTRGVRLGWDVEHASDVGGPAEFQESHGWSGLYVDQEGLKARTDWNGSGEAKLSGKKFVYDSPKVDRWRGNHIRAVTKLSLVMEPARNGSIPLLMSGGAMPTDRKDKLKKITGALGGLLEALREAGDEADVKALGDQLAGAVQDPATKINALLQEIDTTAAKTAPDSAAGSDSVNMSGIGGGKPDPLAELGAEVMAAIGAKSVEEARGLLRAQRENSQALLSARGKLTKTLVQLGLHQVKVKPDEVKELEAKSPEYVEALLSGRSAFANTHAPQTPPKKTEEASAASDDADLDASFDAAVKATKIGGRK